MKNLKLFFAVLLTAIVPLTAFGGGSSSGYVTDSGSGVVYLYDDKFDTICVAPGTKYESDLLPQTSTYRNTIANEVTLWETVELNGKKYDVTAIGAVAFAFSLTSEPLPFPRLSDSLVTMLLPVAAE